MRALLALAIVCLLAPARVDAAKPDKAQLAEAKLHFKKGDEHYARREYDAAIVEFKRAYDLSRLPLLLFNIAQAYRLKGDARTALAYYQDYLRLEPNAPSRAQIEKRIDELERQIAAEDAAAQAPEQPTRPPTPVPTSTPGPSPPPPRVEPPIEAPDEEPGPGRFLRVAGLTTAGVGAACAGLAVVFALKAQSYYDDVSALSAEGGRWSDAWATKLDRADRDKLVAIVLGVAGGAAIAGGGVLYYLGWQKDRDDGIAILPLQGGVVVGARGEF